MNLFTEQFELEAIERIQRFAKIAKALDYEVAIGFSGGKDSQVTYDLCKRARIEFKAYYNVSFESSVTKRFIKEFYPDVIWRQDHKFGFIENIVKNHGGMLPTNEKPYCCKDYKHNPRYVDKCSIIGVRKAESRKRKTRTALSIKNKTTLKKYKETTSSFFYESCHSIGTSSDIQLLPIVDWSDMEVWDYIKVRKLPINPEYREHKRVGCIICPKAGFASNFLSLKKYPKLIDVIIKAKETHPRCDYVITSDNKNNDYSDNKVEYVCRWLNNSFKAFENRRERAMCEEIKQIYNNLK